MRETIAISITEGRVIRDLFYNDFLKIVEKAGYGLLVISSAVSVPDFVNKWSSQNVKFLRFISNNTSTREDKLQRLRKEMRRLGEEAFRLWIDWESRNLSELNGLPEQLKKHNCRLVVITHPMSRSEIPVYLAAKRLKLPVLGILRSWDNLHKGLYIYPDILSVWNEVNRREAIDLMKFPSDRVKVIGGTQFDPYFDADSVCNREEFASTMGLDPFRPIITLATLGAFLHLYDETYLVDFLLDAIKQGKISGNPQLVIRLHPASKLEYFLKYTENPDVRLSYVKEYIPSLGWTMNRDDVTFIGNLLRHSNVVVSPGSTITIETAIFDTPTVVPIFHTYQPELGQEQYNFHLTKHFKRLADLDLVPIVRDPEALIGAINRYLLEPQWYQLQRAQLVKDYIGFIDGKSTERLMSLMSDMIQKEKNK